MSDGGGNELMKFVVHPDTFQLAGPREACEKLQMESVSSVSQARMAAEIEPEPVQGKS